MLEPIFSEPVIRARDDDSTEYEIAIAGSTQQLFQQWASAAPDEEVSNYFRSIGQGLTDRGVQHYHLKVSNGRFNPKTRCQANNFSAVVFYGGDPGGDEGPLNVRAVVCKDAVTDVVLDNYMASQLLQLCEVCA
jgi:hypothetical protein